MLIKGQIRPHRYRIFQGEIDLGAWFQRLGRYLLHVRFHGAWLTDEPQLAILRIASEGLTVAGIEEWANSHIL